MDFSAWFEVYLGGTWHTMDARHNKPRIGRLLMARGRDATDAAISTAFGNAELKRFDIITKEILAGQFQTPAFRIRSAIQLVHVPVLQHLAGDQLQARLRTTAAAPGGMIGCGERPDCRCAGIRTPC